MKCGCGSIASRTVIKLAGGKGERFASLKKAWSSLQSKWRGGRGRVTDVNCDPWVINDIHLLCEDLKTTSIHVQLLTNSGLSPLVSVLF